MEHLRDGIHLRGYGQRDPKQEYKKEGFNLFINMMARVSSNVLTKLFQVEAEKNEIEAMEEAAAKRHLAELQQAVARHVGEEAVPAKKAPAGKPGKPSKAPAAAPTVQSSDPCPCGSGRKFRECHGAALGDDAA
jgi:preprotein translocase subunit SecA